MFIIVLGVVLGLIVFGIIHFQKVAFGKMKTVAGLFLGLLSTSIVISFACFTMIPANSVGIQYNPFSGGVLEDVLEEGFHPKNPVTEIYVISTEIQSKQIGINNTTGQVDPYSALSGQTKDSQYLTIALDVKYRINRENAYEVFRNFKTLDVVDRQLITPAAQRAIESVTVNYNIIEILGSERNNIYHEIEGDLNERLSKSGIELYSITFLDTDAGDEIENAIAQEATAAKQVDIAEQEKLRAEIQKETSIIEAEAAKEVKILEAEGQAQSIEIIQEQLSKDPTYIEYLKWTNWDGVLPSTLVTDETDLIIQP